ncbi:unnamed protein product [Moneuplotes crassus]|uniref:B box-type domain-containing protein n=1 Tax=Euplotes crassus TaxID=5936 RepID=A0AAD2D7F4_EUPCR|nr:unnamed protein product [Moneuplotes crassus]
MSESNEERIKLKLDTDQDENDMWPIQKDSDVCNLNKYIESTFHVQRSPDSSTSDHIFKDQTNFYNNKKEEYFSGSKNFEDKITLSENKIPSEQSKKLRVKSAQLIEEISTHSEQNRHCDSTLNDRMESRESSMDENEYRCQKCECLFDEKSHLPLGLPSGHYFCKECIIRLQIQKARGMEMNFKIPKDISRLPVLSMLINKSTVRNTTASNSKLFTKNVKESLSSVRENTKELKLCSKHKSEKLLYYCENTSEIMCVYCAFETKQSTPDFQITEVHKKLDKLLLPLSAGLDKKMSVLKNQLNSLKSLISTQKACTVSMITKEYTNLIERIQTERQNEIEKATKQFEQTMKELEGHENNAIAKIKKFSQFVHETSGLINKIPHKGLSKMDYENIQEVYQVVKQDFDELKFEPQSLNVFRFQKSLHRYDCGKLKLVPVKEIQQNCFEDRIHKKNLQTEKQRVDEFKDIKEEEDNLEGYFSSSRAPTFGKIKSHGQTKVKSNFIPSPSKDMIFDNADKESDNLLDDSSLCIPITPIDNYMESPQTNSKNFKDEENLLRNIPNNLQAFKHQELGKLNQKSSSPMKRFGSRNNDYKQLTQDWIDQDLNGYIKPKDNSQRLDTKIQQHLKNEDTKNPYKTLEAHENQKPQEMNQYFRNKSEDRMEQKRNKSKRKRNERSLKGERQPTGESKFFDNTQDFQRYLPSQEIDVENHRKEIEQRYNFERALSCDMKTSDVCEDNSKDYKRKFYKNVRNNEFKNYHKKDGNTSSSGMDSFFLENLPGRKQPKKYAPDKCRIGPKIGSKLSRDQFITQSRTAKGLFSNNEAINSRKNYFQKLGENLKKQSVDYSRSSINENEGIVETKKYQSSKMGKRSLFSSVMPGFHK